MGTRIEEQLAAELQEMYLENKEWSSDLLFLADEMRFFQQIFKRAINTTVRQDDFEQFEFVKLGLLELAKRSEHLKGLVDQRQHLLESMIKSEVKTISIDFIEEDTTIVNEIKALLSKDKRVRKDLFALIEGLQAAVKTNKFPIIK